MVTLDIDAKVRHWDRSISVVCRLPMCELLELCVHDYGCGYANDPAGAGDVCVELKQFDHSVSLPHHFQAFGGLPHARVSNQHQPLVGTHEATA